MTPGIFNQTSKWLLASFVALTFQCYQAEASEDLSMLGQEISAEVLTERIHRHKDKHQNLENPTIFAFLKLAEDFHDTAVSLFWNSTSDSVSSYSHIIADDIQRIGVILTALNSADGAEFINLLAHYLSAGVDYLGAIPTFSIVPNNQSELISHWQEAGRLLANFVISRRSISEAQADHIRNLFLAWTNAQIGYLNNAAPQSIEFFLPVDASASIDLYTRARVLTAEVAILVFNTFRAL